MQQRNKSKFPNSIKLSEFGITFLKQLPVELEDLENSHRNKENILSIHHSLQRRGAGIQFAAFANQTQSILRKQTYSISQLKSDQPQTSESKRKLQLHYKNWLSDQKLLHHKIADQQSRLEQLKYSQYDWRAVSSNLKERTTNILEQWSELNSGRLVRKRAKLSKLMARKYPKNQQ